MLVHEANHRATTVFHNLQASGPWGGRRAIAAFHGKSASRNTAWCVGGITGLELRKRRVGQDHIGHSLPGIIFKTAGGLRVGGPSALGEWGSSLCQGTQVASHASRPVGP